MAFGDSHGWGFRERFECMQRWLLAMAMARYFVKDLNWCNNGFQQPMAMD